MGQRGGERTFESIYQTYRDGMFRYAQTLTNGDRSIAEDVLQHAFMDVARNIHRLASLEDVQIKAYLLRAVQTWARKLMKKERTLHEVEQRWETKCAPLFRRQEEDLLDRLCVREQMDTIRQALREMPEEYRMILTSYYLLEENLHEVARQMRLPYTTVQKRCQRGTQMLVDQLKRKVKKGEL
ncbi:MAG: sigma-70 family RNA polymerase sigma factor [Clostridia bacterium]|nr:sigma-70 family RNA polymerase sigma factor [Clostridia bacterium]